MLTSFQEEISRPSKDQPPCQISIIELPEDLVYEIFLRLPVKSLIRFRCISKDNCEMIDSPMFIKSHNYHRFKNKESLSDDYSIILNRTRNNIFSSVNFYKDNLNRAKVVKLRSTLPENRIFSIWCCNGIFCFQMNTLPSSFFLWNPSNGTSKKVEYSSIVGSRVLTGYDYVNNDFKIIRILDRNATSMDIYSSRKDSWRKFNGKFSLGTLLLGTGVCVNGGLHWLCRNLTASSMFIAVFDLATETFSSLSLPLGQDLEAFDIKDFAGCLCIIFAQTSYYIGAQTFWVMEKYGDERSWTKLYTINCILPMSYYPNKKSQLLCNKRWLTWLNPQDASMEDIEFEVLSFDRLEWCQYYIYVRNLFRL